MRQQAHKSLILTEFKRSALHHNAKDEHVLRSITKTLKDLTEVTSLRMTRTAAKQLKKM